MGAADVELETKSWRFDLAKDYVGNDTHLQTINIMIVIFLPMLIWALSETRIM